MTQTQSPVFDFSSGKSVPFGAEAFQYCNWMDISDYWLGDPP